MLIIALVVVLVTQFYIAVRNFNRLKNFRKNVDVGWSVHFYHAKHQCFVEGVVVKCGVEYVEVKIPTSDRVYLLHKNDISQPEYE